MGGRRCRSTVRPTRPTSSRSRSTSSASLETTPISCPESCEAGLGRTLARRERGIRCHCNCKGSEWHLSPLGRRRGELKLWQSYSREEIPAALRPRVLDGDLECRLRQEARPHLPARDAGQVRPRRGVPVSRPLHRPHGVRVAKPEQDGAGQCRRSEISRTTLERNIAVHLFVRTQKRRPGGGSAPFIYCGDVRLPVVGGRETHYGQVAALRPVPDNIWKTVQTGT